MGLEADTNLFFQGYQKTSLMMLPKNLVNEWENLNKNTLEQSKKYEISFDQAIDDAKKIMGLTRAYADQKQRTPYGLIRQILGRNLLPEIYDETIDKYRAKIVTELKENEKEIKETETV